MNIVIKSYLAAVMTVIIVLSACSLYAEDPAASTILPNIYGKSVTTPVGWGASNGTIFAAVGIESRAPYRHGGAFSTQTGDGGAAVGLGIGNPVKNLGLQATLTQYDLTAWNRY